MTESLKALNRQLKKDAKNKVKGGNIPPSVTNIPSGLNEHLGDTFQLIFEYYDHSQCEMIKMSKDEMKQVFNLFKRITKYNQTNISQLCRPDPVKREGAGKGYKNLFNNLPRDFDSLLEVDFTGSGRIFIYPYQNICCVVAVNKEHR